MSQTGRPRVRLVKAVLQLHFNYDDGEHLREIQGVRPILIEAKDWPAAVEERYSELVQEIEQQVTSLLDEESGAGGEQAER